MINVEAKSERPSQEEKDAAYAKILRCVSACEQSSVRIRKKLEAAGYADKAIDDALERAFKTGALDDHRYAECLVRSHMMAGKGMEHAKREIISLGICLDDVEAYREYLAAGEDAQIEAACDFLARHPSRAKDQRSAAFRKLLNKGYSMDMASKAVTRWIELRDVAV